MSEPWRDEWTVLARRLDGVCESLRFLLQAHAVRDTALDSIVAHSALPVTQALLTAMESFATRHRMLPPAAATLLRDGLPTIRTQAISEMSDVIEGEMTYRHVNIAIAPSVPSKAARKRT